MEWPAHLPLVRDGGVSGPIHIIKSADGWLCQPSGNESVDG